MNKTRLTILSVCAVSLSAFAALSTDSATVELRYITAFEAQKALEERLGPEASSAIRSVDLRRNALSIDAAHPQAARVRKFVASLDHRPAQVSVRAVISRQVEATADSPAREEILSRPSFFSRADQPLKLSVPGEGSTINIELQVTYIPAQQP